LADLGGLESVTRVGSVLWVEGNDSLGGLTGLESLTTIGGELWIFRNASLTRLAGLESLTTILLGLSVVENPLLPTCEAEGLLDQLVDFTGTVEIRENDAAGTCP
jgi:hypothetical protein